jgi:hypothetical protein
VLALADWESRPADLEAPPAAWTWTCPARWRDALDGGFQLNVCFHTKEQALAAEAAIIDLPGVFDVRHDF